jgi:hypothetical protein
VKEENTSRHEPTNHEFCHQTQNLSPHKTTGHAVKEKKPSGVPGPKYLAQKQKVNAPRAVMGKPPKKARRDLEEEGRGPGQFNTAGELHS